MASRKDQKEQARQERLAKEQEAKAAAQRRQRLQIISGVGAIAVILIVVVVVITSGGGPAKATANPHAKTNVAAQSHVNAVLSGIQQPAGTNIVLGNPHAKLTITEWGDLECSICDIEDTPSGWQSPDGQSQGFQGTGSLDTIIAKYVRTGRAKLVYKSMETATTTPNPSRWYPQQSAAYAAALQGKGWDYVQLFYMEQGVEGAHYVTDDFLEGIAKQIPGLDYAQWYKDWTTKTAKLKAEINAENTEGVQLDTPLQDVGTPTVYVTGPKGSSQPLVGSVPASRIEAAITSVS